jgi:nitroimidazol reductase NimA-like FMN-containing flavoprotein (pyridoxamine 5'-phosphate oxidase superfamily)
VHEEEVIHRILDGEFLSHVGIVHDNSPVVIPTLYGRERSTVYIHGASVSRLIIQIEQGIELLPKCLVLARSAFHHSLNYESVVVLGKGNLVEDVGKKHEVKVISDHVLKGRWEETRLPNKTELKATKIIEIEISEATAKNRTGDPIDEKADFDLPIWAGVLPIETCYGTPVSDSKLALNIEMSFSIKAIQYKKKGPKPFSIPTK